MTRRGKVLVTGANSGLGLATSIELAGAGYEVVGSVRSEAKAAALHDAAEAEGVVVEHVIMDVTDAAACEAAVKQVGPLYGLVNNAGGGGTGAVEDVSDDEARHTLEAMVVGPMRLARLAIPGMREAGAGRIVNISSIYGKVSTPMTGWYQGAKHALEGLSDALRMEVARDGIAVVLVEPGAFKTAIFDAAHASFAGQDESAYRRSYDRSATLARLSEPFMGNPKQVAKVVRTALGARSPRDRYLVGIDAQSFDLANRLVPRPIMDRVTRLTMGL
jgi:NAD(P)-dependent dehydrogenase (short-subunit alcohol dehydrogenase family)